MFAKRRKLAKEKAERLAKQREMEAKIKVRRYLSNMKSQVSKIDGIKKNYIDKARKALLSGNNQSYQLAVGGLKSCLSRQRFLEGMLMNFEITMEMNDMNKLIGEFLEGMNIISKEMSNITTNVDFIKMQTDFENAMSGNIGQYEALESFISSAAANFESINFVGEDVTDDEIKNLISNKAIDSESSLDADIDKKLEEVREKISNLN